MRSLSRFLLPLIVFLLSACQKIHIPYFVDQIPTRAQIISGQTQGLSPRLVVLALKAYNKAQATGYGEKHILTIINYSAPSNQDRLWVIDLDQNKVLFTELVAHGVGSGDLYATRFSDRIDSRSTSLGMYETAPEAYVGRYGYALRLRGLEPGFNSHAWSRAIVVHAAPYVCDEHIKEYGEVGRSWGCFAVDPKYVHGIINTIKGETLIFAYANNSVWLHRSRFLNP